MLASADAVYRIALDVRIVDHIIHFLVGQVGEKNHLARIVDGNKPLQLVEIGWIVRVSLLELKNARLASINVDVRNAGYNIAALCKGLVVDVIDPNTGDVVG